MNQSFFLQTFFHSALAILEPQIYILVENSLGRKISRCSAGVLFVFFFYQDSHWRKFSYQQPTVFMRYLRSGYNPNEIFVILSFYKLVSGQRASFKTVPPPRDRQHLGGKMSWCHGGLPGPYP